MARIYLMRHGQTLFNLMDLNQGQSDSPLTELGIKQALVAKKWFDNHQIEFDAAYTSTSERAVDTTELVTKQSYTKLKGLKEIFLGTKEATPASENPSYPYGDYFVEFGGEGLDAFTERFYQTLRSIAAKQEPVVLVVAHGMGIKRFLTKIGYQQGNLQMLGNCDIVILDVIDDQFEVIDIIHHGV